MNGLEQHIKIYEEVKDAIQNNIPVIALESTLISHGMPYPENLEAAAAVRNIIRNNGAIPATIAVIKGKIKIGISQDEIEMLAENKDVIKISTRDIPYVMTKGLNGATTLAATMFIASLVNIKVFATGGIGGVHMNGALTMDISSDLIQLTKDNIVVVCSGTKPGLDIRLTIEALETLGIPVIGYKTTNFPAFYLRKSGYRATYSFDTVEDIAKSIKLKWGLGLNGGILIANPIPKEHELEESVVNDAIDKAVFDAESKKIMGKELTPYLLSTINKITNNLSLNANIELYKSNASLAAKLSGELEKLYPAETRLESRKTI